MKYVAYLDILGFKERLKNLEHQRAKKFISDFASTIYNSWVSNLEYETYLEGFIVSDSFIINTKNSSVDSLRSLLSAIIDVCQSEFLQHGVILRGGIAKGEYNKLQAKDLKHLAKGLIVGQAYIDAYLLEATVKTIGTVVTEEVYEDILASNMDIANRIFEENIGNEKKYVFSSFSLDFLNEKKNLEQFITLAVSSGWLPHYYNALYFSLKNENVSVVNILFDNIFKILSGDSYSENWRNVDKFIKGAFNESVFRHFQTRFLTYLRSRIFSDKKG